MAYNLVKRNKPLYVILLATTLLSTFSFALLPKAQAVDCWETPQNLGPLVNTAFGEYSARLSQDMLTLYFCAYNRTGGYGLSDIWMSTRPSIYSDWGAPVNLGPTINTPYHDIFACESADGLTLHVTSTKPGGYGNEDIYKLTRYSRSEPWGIPTNTGPPINTAWGECQSAFTVDGLTMYFGSDRPGSHGGSHIWMSTRPSIGSNWIEPVNLDLNTTSAYEAWDPSISPNGLVLYFDSDRPGGYGGNDIWMSTRPSIYSDWGAPVNLGPTINTQYDEYQPWICSDGITLYWSVDKPGGYGNDDLYVSRYEISVGGVSVPIDKFGLLAPYIGLASAFLVATVATAIYVKRVKRRKEKQ
jgi:hypothetical protein